MCIKRILGFTGIRSDYEIMSELYKSINCDEELEISLIVCGAHLSESYGYSVSEIHRDGIKILGKIENLIDSNSREGRLKSLSILLQDCISHVSMYNPDLIVYAGDREEVMVGALCGAYLRIPTIHFFGGDHAIDGNIDNVVRHGVSKLSSLHFVTNEESYKRLMKIGEEEKRIFNVGSPSLDRIINTKKISKKELLKSFNLEDFKDYAILLYYPLAGEEELCGEQFREILCSLEERKIKAFVSYPNVDGGNKNIIKVIEEYKGNNNFYFYKNLERELFINLLRNARFLIGNSSCGVYESTILKLPVINVGNRQKGRLAGENVLFVTNRKEDILSGIDRVLEKSFKEILKNAKSPYGEGKSIEKIIELLKTLDLNWFLEKNNDPLFMGGKDE
ncbi:MAG: UDP-N-acetylglucosamine 2-epimerase [Clostridium sp.]